MTEKLITEVSEFGVISELETISLGIKPKEDLEIEYLVLQVADPETVEVDRLSEGVYFEFNDQAFGGYGYVRDLKLDSKRNLLTLRVDHPALAFDCMSVKVPGSVNTTQRALLERLAWAAGKAVRNK